MALLEEGARSFALQVQLPSPEAQEEWRRGYIEQRQGDTVALGGLSFDYCRCPSMIRKSGFGFVSGRQKLNYQPQTIGTSFKRSVGIQEGAPRPRTCSERERVTVALLMPKLLKCAGYCSTFESHSGSFKSVDSESTESTESTGAWHPFDLFSAKCLSGCRVCPPVVWCGMVWRSVVWGGLWCCGVGCGWCGVADGAVDEADLYHSHNVAAHVDTPRFVAGGCLHEVGDTTTPIPGPHSPDGDNLGPAMDACA